MAEIENHDPVADAVAFLEQEAEIPEVAEGDTEAEGIGTSPSVTDEPVVETKPVEKPPEPKPEEKLTPQMEALARKERRVQEDRHTLKGEREAFAKERETWAQERSDYESLERIARTDLVTLADKVKMTPTERQRLAIELWNSAQPEDKQPPAYREQAKTRTQSQELADRLARLEAENQAAVRRAQQAETRASQAELGEQITASVEDVIAQVGDRAPYLVSLLKHDRPGVKEDLYNLAQQMYNDDPDREITAALLVERYEPLLAAKFEPLKRVFGTQPPKGNPKFEAEKTPPKTLSAQRVATPTQARPEPKSDEDLIQDAVSFLESR